MHTFIAIFIQSHALLFLKVEREPKFFQIHNQY